MARLFITLYLGLVASLIIIVLVLELLVLQPWVADLERRDSIRDFQGLTTFIEMLNLDNSLSLIAPQMEEAFANSNVKIKFRPLGEFTDVQTELQALEPGDFYLQPTDEDPLVYYRFEEADWVLRVGPIETIPELEQAANIILALLLLAMALACLLWLYLLQRKLKRLEQGALSLAEGNLTARVPEEGRWRIGHLNASFNLMAERISRLLHSHKQLTNAVAHELRTPIFRLRLQLDMLQQAPEQERQELMQGIAEDIDELDTLVEELLEYARMERTEAKLELSQISLNHWLAAQIEHLRPESPLALGLQLPSQIIPQEVDERLFSRALHNLVRNAFHHAKRQVQVSLIQQGTNIHILVEDDGPGVAPEEREQIFSPFTRLNSSRSQGGYGLGLSIVREVMRLHNGQVCVSASHTLGGACFELILPQPIQSHTEQG